MAVNDNGFMTFTAPGSALSQHRRVRLDSGVLAYCGTSDQDCLGQLVNPCLAADAIAAVRLVSKEGTAMGIASEALSVGAACYAGANGKCAATGTVLVGEVLSAASADGDVFEFLPSPAGVLPAVARSGLTEDALAAFDVMGDLKGADGADLALSETAGDFFKNIGTNQDLIDGEATVNETEVSVGIFTFTLPECYVAGGDIKIRAAAGIVLAGDASLTSATIDFECYKQATDGTVGSDLVATAATAIDTTFANKDFTVTPTGLVAGDKLNIKMTTSVVEAATGTGAANSRITRLQMLCDIKG